MSLRILLVLLVRRQRPEYRAHKRMSRESSSSRVYSNKEILILLGKRKKNLKMKKGENDHFVTDPLLLITKESDRPCHQPQGCWLATALKYSQRLPHTLSLSRHSWGIFFISFLTFIFFCFSFDYSDGTPPSFFPPSLASPAAAAAAIHPTSRAGEFE